MKNYLFLLLVLLFSLNSFAQEVDIQAKLDSIIEEADLMYKYEKTVWVSTDLLMLNKKLKKNYGGYIVNHSNDTITVTYLDKDQKNSIARYSFIFEDLYKPINREIGISQLTTIEQELFDIKLKIINQLSNEKFNVTFPEHFDPNLVLIKSDNGYKLYIIMGTSESGVIPFGNDYLFLSDIKGNITYWQKFHSRMIPAYAKGPNGEKVVSAMHSHLKTTPYISATDICTFRLYAELCDMEEFSVYCTATKTIYNYYLKTNTIEFDKP